MSLGQIEFVAPLRVFLKKLPGSHQAMGYASWPDLPDHAFFYNQYFEASSCIHEHPYEDKNCHCGMQMTLNKKYIFEFLMREQEWNLEEGIMMLGVFDGWGNYRNCGNYNFKFEKAFFGGMIFVPSKLPEDVKQRLDRRCSFQLYQMDERDAELKSWIKSRQNNIDSKME